MAIIFLQFFKIAKNLKCSFLSVHPADFPETGSYHKRQISNPPTPLPPMFKTAKVQFRQRC